MLILLNFRNPTTLIGMDRNKIKALLGLATSDRERELIRCSVFKASGLTQTGARKHFGFEGMDTRAERVEKSIEAAPSIREAIDKLALLQDKALLASMGLEAESISSESESDTNSESETASFSNKQLPSFETLKEYCSRDSITGLLWWTSLNKKLMNLFQIQYWISTLRNFIHLHWNCQLNLRRKNNLPLHMLLSSIPSRSCPMSYCFYVKWRCRN